MHHYPFHPGDYLKHTAHLSPMEDLAYRRLLDMYYDTEQRIPLETQSVSRRLRLDSEVVANVLNEFFLPTETGWQNTRADEEIAKYRARSAANRENGKAGGRPKKTQSVSSGLPDLTQNNLNQEPRTKNHIKNGNAALPDGFAEFWAAYPNRKNKKNAERAWSSIKPDAELKSQILRAVEVAMRGDDWRKDGGRFIPHPASWLNGRRWEDEPAPRLSVVPAAYDPCRGAI